jgi:radical SAM protein with 4Fe4S-binding SPASM domain
VSLWAGSEAEYEENHPGAGPEYFNTIVNALRHLTRLKAAQAGCLPSVVMHHPIYRNNFDSIQTIAGLAHETGCDTLSFSPLRTRRGRLGSFALTQDETKLLSLNLARIKRRLDSLSIGHNIDNTILRYRVGEKVWEKVPCYVGWVQVHIKVDGTVLPCNSCSLPMGNLNEQSLSHIWNGSSLKRFRRQTLTKEGLAHMGPHCDCHFCCHVEDNMRVHRIFRWFSPFLPGKKNRKAWLSMETS